MATTTAKTVSPASNNTVTVTDNTTGKSFDLPIMDGTMGPRVIDVRKLYTDHGFFTYDPGFTSTGSCESTITYIDGEQGVLLHRGYPIQELAEHSDFVVVLCHLLEGELPRGAQRRKFVQVNTRDAVVDGEDQNVDLDLHRD